MYIYIKKNENHHRILHIRNSLGSKFQIQQIVLIFWNKFPKKKVTSTRKQEKKKTSPWNSSD